MADGKIKITFEAKQTLPSGRALYVAAKIFDIYHPITTPTPDQLPQPIPREQQREAALLIDQLIDLTIEARS